MAEILMVTAVVGVENCSAALSRQFQMQVQTVPTRREAITALRRGEYRVVIFDESLVESAGDAGDLAADGDDPLYRYLGGAIPVEVNFAISGCGRLLRMVRAALGRARLEGEAAAHAAAASVDREWRETAAGLLLQAQLAQAESGVPPALAERLKTIAGLAEKLCGQVSATTPANSQNPASQPPLRPSPRRPAQTAFVPQAPTARTPVVRTEGTRSAGARGAAGSKVALPASREGVVSVSAALAARSARRIPATV